VLLAIGRGLDPDEAMVADHMSDSTISAPPDWSLERAAEEMVKSGIRHLVVVDHGELVGVLSMRDIVRCWTRVGATVSVSPP
jgi:CBS domain-containing protein